ncbi:MAG TPA: nitroreductase family deazaflavin-dependent oxidoreductase, partial [Tepidiformaceae bacterium]|nr:nitroreductase family deazaflavin-dependent oxidoreductase [Tepidiformaceae bacterium]
AVRDEQYCYLTTTGRKTGEPREIEIWFGVIGGALYMLSGSGEDERGPKAHWVRNLLKAPACTVRIAGETVPAAGRIVERGTAEDAAARELLVAKYRGSSSGDLSDWGRRSVVVALDFK